MNHYHNKGIPDDSEPHNAKFWRRLLYGRIDRFSHVHNMFYGPSLFLLNFLSAFRDLGDDITSLKAACAYTERRINELLA